MSIEFDFSQVLLQHLQLSLIPALLGVLLGGALGAVLGNLIAKWRSNHPALAGVGIWLPWRSICFIFGFLGLLGPLLLLSFRIRVFGLGMTTGQWSVGLAIFFLALFFTPVGMLNSSRPVDPPGRLLGTFRTLILAAYFLSLPYDYGAGGAGALMTRSLNLLDYGSWQQGILIVALLALLTDLVLGLVQYLVTGRKRVNELSTSG